MTETQTPESAVAATAAAAPQPEAPAKPKARATKPRSKTCARKAPARAARSTVDDDLPPPLPSAEGVTDLSDPRLYINREINWIEFDRKVLDEACDPNVPLLEQLKFLSIFYNNLDEFFMVRVSNICRQMKGGASSSSPDELPPAKQLAEIRKRVLGLLNRA